MRVVSAGLASGGDLPETHRDVASMLLRNVDIGVGLNTVEEDYEGGSIKKASILFILSISAFIDELKSAAVVGIGGIACRADLGVTCRTDPGDLLGTDEWAPQRANNKDECHSSTDGSDRLVMEKSSKKPHLEEAYEDYLAGSCPYRGRGADRATLFTGT